MNKQFEQEFDALTDKFAELITGKTSDDIVNKIKLWSIYNHIHKTMPALTKHWNQEYPQSRVEMRELFEEIKTLNEAHRKQSENSQNTSNSKEK